ncbi:MAG TPA: TonB-dependent receptor [Vicinamibacterales bacterium]|nr:TonB-dependent receptor [Vicinamibacterales bacterium]
MRTALKCLTLAVVLLLPSTVFAQASLTGTVRDASGGVLPGVTVEAASPALIEKVRSAVTDGSGQYRIIDLRPGVYSLTFTLPGFNSVKRENIELTGSQTLTIPAEMKVGGLEETITVTGETPVVDVQNATRQLVMKDDVIQAIPATRAAGALLNATPGINVGEAGAALSPTMTAFNARSSTINSGSVAGEGRYAINGFPLTAARSGGFASVVYDTVNVEEVAITVGGGLGESDIGGPLMNIVPKSGGNTFSGSGFLSTAGKWSSGDNLTPELQALNPNLRQAAAISRAYDWNASLGGPIMKDRLWFYGSYRDLDTQIPLDGIVANKYAGDASHWDWAADPSVSARLVQGRTMMIGRLTGQFGKNRARFYSEYQKRCEGSSLTVSGEGCHKRGADWVGLGNNAAPTQMSPEATSTAARGYFDVPFYINQGTWTNAASNKLLFEAGIQFFRYQPIFGQPAPDGITNLIPVTQQSNAINPATNTPFAPVANFRYRGMESWGPAKGSTDDGTGSMSYVTGAHNTKVGYQYRMLDLQDDDMAGQTQLGYRFNGATPNAVSYYLPEMGRRTITKTHGVYVQDTWTLNRLTVQGALRWDRASSYAPVEGNGTFGKTSFLNPVAITIQETKGVDTYNDLTPRVGVAYDVFGNGRTALKLNWGKYLAYAANDSPYTSTNPGATIVRNVLNRGWNASVAAGGNGDLVVDCDLLNPNANGECAAVVGNSRNFGKAGSASQVDPAVLSGWGVRPGDTQTTVTVQQQVIPRVSADFSYTHRNFHGFFVSDDINRNFATSYESYTLTAPQDSRLPGGGGYPVVVFVPTTAANAVTPQTILRQESYFGDQRLSKWDGVEASVNARTSIGLVLQVGSSTGRALVDRCETIVKFNNVNANTGVESGPNPRGCHDVEPWQTTLRGSATYTVPKIDVLVSAVVRSQPPALLGGTPDTAATWQVPNSVIAAALGHLPPGATATGTTNIPLGDNEHRIYADNRRSQIDMRFAKIVRFGRTRTDIGVDLNNLTNTNYATGYNNTYIYGTDNTPRPSGWGTPTSTYNPRFVRLNFTVNF